MMIDEVANPIAYLPSQAPDVTRDAAGPAALGCGFESQPGRIWTHGDYAYLSRPPRSCSGPPTGSDPMSEDARLVFVGLLTSRAKRSVRRLFARVCPRKKSEQTGRGLVSSGGPKCCD